MDETLLAGDVYLNWVFDSKPEPLFIVDHEVRIMYLNAAARDFLGVDPAGVNGMRAGMALDCRNAYWTARGCGRSAACDDCVIRTAVSDAIQGFSSHRKTVILERMRGDAVKMFPLQVTASPFRFSGKPYVLLVLEPLTG